MGLEGKTVVVLGGSSGIGLATAQLAKQQGAVVTTTGRSVEKLQATAEQLGGVDTAVVDVADEESVRGLFESLGHVDHVLMAAGGMAGGGQRITEADTNELQPAIDQRIWGAVYVAKHAAPRMTNGSITLISGILATRPTQNVAIVAAASGAVEALMRALAVELAPIRVNALAPGWVDTPLVSRTLGDQRDAVINGVSSKLPVGRIGTPEDIAHAALFLMTNGYMTGEVLHIDGGGRYI